MRNRNTIVLILIILLALASCGSTCPFSTSAPSRLLFWQQPAENRNLKIKQGLDLQGGTQVLLEARPAAGKRSPPRTCSGQGDRRAPRQRAGRDRAAGAAQGENRIIVELPGIDNPDQAVQTLKSTGQLEFVEIGSSTIGVPQHSAGRLRPHDQQRPRARRGQLGATEFPTRTRSSRPS